MDGEFAPLKVLIESLPGGPFVNLASPDEHVPEIDPGSEGMEPSCSSQPTTIQTYPKALDDTHCAQMPSRCSISSQQREEFPTL